MKGNDAMIEYKTSGTCASEIHFEMDGDRVRSIRFKGGCDGNLKAVSKLCEGMPATDVITKLRGIECGTKRTSCGDQLARALEQTLEGQNAR
jgi:uncharacterized protein (TIGR03905 family)